MGIVGNAEDARLIHNHVREHGRHGPAPKGWKRAGQGSFRSAWLSPDGVVYKVQHYHHSHQSNEGEIQNILKILSGRPLPEQCRIPQATFYDVGNSTNDGVIAMECVNGKTVYERYDYRPPAEVSNRIESLSKAVRLRDLHDENVMIDDNTGDLVLVDLGM